MGAVRNRKHVTFLQYAAYHLHIRPSPQYSDALFRMDRLGHEFICDMFATSEQQNMAWVLGHHDTIRADLYQGVRVSTISTTYFHFEYASCVV